MIPPTGRSVDDRDRDHDGLGRRAVGRCGTAGTATATSAMHSDECSCACDPPESVVAAAGKRAAGTRSGDGGRTARRPAPHRERSDRLPDDRPRELRAKWARRGRARRTGAAMSSASRRETIHTAAASGSCSAMPSQSTGLARRNGSVAGVDQPLEVLLRDEGDHGRPRRAERASGGARACRRRDREAPPRRGSATTWGACAR